MQKDVPSVSGNLFEAVVEHGGLDCLLPFAPQTRLLSKLKQPENWSTSNLGIVVPVKAGLSRICAAWAKTFNATLLNADDISNTDVATLAQLTPRPLIIDDCQDNMDQTLLLSVFNLFKQANQTLVLGTHTPFQAWHITSKDLASRLLTLETVLQPPLEERLAEAWMEVLAKARHIRLPEPTLQYTMRYIDIEYSLMYALIERLDKEYAAQNKPITRHAVRKIALDFGWL